MSRMRYCDNRPNHLCLGGPGGCLDEKTQARRCLREHDISEAPYKVEEPHERVREIIASEVPAPLRVLKGDEKPPTHADTVPKRTAQVIRWRGITRHDLPVPQILEAAADAGLTVAVVLGYDADGKEYFASTVADGADVVWLLERCKLQLLTSGVDPDPV